MPHFDPTGSQGLYLLIALIFVAANAFFVSAEFAIVKIRSTRLEVLASRGNSLAKLSKKIVSNLDAYLSATQLGITLASLGLGWIGEPAFTSVLIKLGTFMGLAISETTLHSVSLTLAFVIISALHIILGELVPKSLAIRTAEKICLAVAIPLRIFYIIFYPALWTLNGLSNLILGFIHIPRVGGPARAHTEEELKLVIEDSFEEGTIGGGKRLLLDKAIDFSHKTVLDIMVPINKIFSFYLDESISSNLERARDSGHTRAPLLDSRGGKIIGFVHMKDIIWSLEHGEIINLYDLKRPILFFISLTKIDQALLRFQKEKVHLGIVTDDRGAVLGLVTLEDIIEELVGEIDDEFDKR